MAEKKELSFEDKLALLSPDDYQDPKGKEDIAGWKERAPLLAARLDFKNHPITRELADEARKEIVRIRIILSTKEDMSDEERKALFREKKVHEIYLGLFTRDVQKELDEIETSVNYELGLR